MAIMKPRQKKALKSLNKSTKIPKIKSINPGSIPSVARAFMMGKPDLPISNKHVIIANTPNLQEVCFPQYTKPWHTSRRTLATKYFTETRSAVWKSIVSAVGSPNGYRNYSQPWNFTYGNAIAPAYLKVAAGPRNKRIVSDYALINYGRDPNGSSIDKNLVKFRAWFHSELMWDSQEQRHIFDANASWACIFYCKSTSSYQPTYPNDVCNIIRYHNELDVAKADRIVFFPWTHLNTFDCAPNNTVWYADLKERLYKFTLDHIHIVPPNIRVDTNWNGLNFNEGYYDHYNHYTASIGVQLLTTPKGHDIVETALKSSLPAESSKALAKYGARLFKDNLASAGLFSDTCNAEIKAILGTLNTYITEFNDPSFLHHVDYDKVLGLITSRSTYGFEPHFAGVMKDSLFKKFPRSKQYRLIAESLFDGTQRGYYGRDLTNMIKTIHSHPAAGPDAVAEAIDTRDVKNFQQYHDEVVKVYNKIKYAPKLINPAIYNFLLDYGLEIPDTDLIMKLPEDTNVIREWGATQNHCLGSYVDRCFDGSTLILGVWDEGKEEWAGHIQMYPPQLHSIREWRLEYLNAIPKIKKPPGKTIKVKTGTTKVTWSSNFAVSFADANSTGTNATYKSVPSPPVVSISQFYAKRNTPVEATAKAAVLDHLNKALQQYAARWLDVNYAVYLFTI